MIEVETVREIHPSAKIAPDARIGSHCVVGPDVTIGPGTVLEQRVCVIGNTVIGSGNYFEQGCVFGAEPQDLKYKGERTLLLVGSGNRFGRNVTAHIGTELGGYLTRVGDRNVLEEGSHVAHDCYIDDHTHLGRYVSLAGHIHVQQGAVIEDYSGVHHFVTIGKYARVGRRTPVRRDVPPYTFFWTEDPDKQGPSVRGPHDEGIRSAKLDPLEEKELRQALRELFEEEAALQTKIEQFVNLGVEGQVAEICQFIQRSLQGLYGRDRERYRGKAPPEAERFLPPELRAKIRRSHP